MAKLIYNGGSYTFNTDAETLRALERATYSIFAQGRGCALHTFGTDDTGKETCHGIFLSPNVPLQFVYEAGEFIEPDDEKVARFLDGLLDPLGLTLR